ncbi:MAG TPA: enoyl-CoA hydratase/isomerase family protein [Acidimicrobiales bacterium]|nr:enoyl-CoA hydratase/isomerase family protein [Acidimicrobiales bacterium]
MDDDPVLLEAKGGIAVLTLNRPDRHNPMGDAMDALFFRYLDLLRTDRDIRVVVWRSNGESFSCGRDMVELVGEDPALSGPANGDSTGDRDGHAVDQPVDEEDGGAAGAALGPTSGETPIARPWRSHAQRHGFGATDFEVLERSQWGTRLLYDFPVPIICALKGWTLGTAFERALLCDVRVAGEGTRMALAGIDHGLIPDAAGLAKLYEIGGSALALDLGLSGRRIGAPEALHLGLVSQVVPDDEVDAAAYDLAVGIAERPPLVVRMVREHVQALAAPAVRGTLGRELVGQTLLLSSHDFEEQRRARAEDRDPRYERR